MTWRGRRAQLSRGLGLVAVSCLVLASCGGNDTAAKPAPTAPSPGGSSGDCGTFTIAYDPSHGYEASAFIVGSLAASQLHCRVRYVKTTSRQAWRLVAGGDADVYLDAYGGGHLRARLAGDGGPVTVVGPNGVIGGVDLLAPAYMGELGLSTAQDLPDVQRIGWAGSIPGITTVPELIPLATAFIEFQNLDYTVRDYNQVGAGHGMRSVLQQPRLDNDRETPYLYLAEGPRQLLGDGPGRTSVEIPESAAQACRPNRRSTLCSLADFKYLKIVNSEFARSKSPAYSLVYNYRLSRNDAATILELVTLSGYDVGAADMTSWLNTHKATWKRWLG